MTDQTNVDVNPFLPEKKIKPVNELISVKKGYISGIKYYYFIIMKERSLSEYPEIYEALVQFGSNLADLLESESADAVANMSALFRTFYPEGNLHKAFEALQLEVALDGISECLLNLKKMYHLSGK
ncbi:MAG: hypothetical protein K5897_00150 [Eubacterium sp.]|nr:hypothetical protein [Eubacterium sp.]